MNFTNKPDTVRRTVLRKIKNGNIRHRLENKKTSIMFSFNPNTKIGVLSAEITPTIKEVTEYAVYGEAPALPIEETKIISALQQVLKTYNTPDVAVNDRLIVYVTNAYLKTIDQPYSFIDSKRIRRIVETFLKKSIKSTNENNLLEEYGKDIKWLKSMVLQKSEINNDVSEANVKNLIESFERKIQEVANQLPHMRTEIQTKLQGDETRVHELVETVRKEIHAKLDDESKHLKKEFHHHDETRVNALVETLRKEIHTKLDDESKHLKKEFHVDETRVNVLVETLRKEIHTKLDDESKHLKKEFHVDETRVNVLVETLRKEIHTKLDDESKHLKKEIYTRLDDDSNILKNEIHTRLDDDSNILKKEIYTRLDDDSNILKKEIYTRLEDESKNLKKEIHMKLGDESKELGNLKTELQVNIKQQIEDITKRFPTMDLTQVVEKLQTDLYGSIQKQIDELRDAAFIEACVENYWSKLVSETEELKSARPQNMEIIIERIVKRYVEKDHSIADSCDDHTLQYDEMYGGSSEFQSIENTNPIIDHIMNGGGKQPKLEEEDIYMDDVYQKQSETFNIVHHVNELRSSADKKWVPFGKGVGNTVMDMYVDPETKKIYITGLFEQVDNVAANNIASYDITKKKWEHVGNGINNLGVCLAMDLENQILYIGGIFNSVDQEPNALAANNIVSYNLFKNEWETLGEGFNAECACLCFDNEHKILYAGGAFTKIGDENISYVAFYDRVQNKWFPLSDEVLNGPCRTMCMDTESRELFLGGVFTEIGEYMYYYVASFDTRSKEWTELCGGLQGNCNCLCLNSDAKILYVGGTFDSVGSEENRVESRHVASYHLENHEWSPLAQGLDGVCHTMIYNSEQKCLIIGGAFTHVVDSNIIVNHVVKYDTVENVWLPFDNFFDINNAQKKDNIGLDGNCNSLCMDENAYYMCGTFKKAGTVHANSIVKYLHHKVKL